MRFHEHVVLYDFCGIPMAGNLDNGFTVGLTPEGAALCRRLQEGEVPEEEARAVDGALLQCLEQAGFLGGTQGVAPLRMAYLHVTQRCNLRCAGCYSLDGGRNRLEDAPFEDMARAVDQLAGAGVSTLIVSGGETFLRPDLPQLVQRAKEAGIGSVTVITNGTCAGDEMLAALAPWADTVAVSFDGWSADCPAHIRGEQRFYRLCDAVRRVQAAGMAAHITPTIHKKNAGDLARYVELAAELGATMNYSLLSCEFTGELAGLLPGEEELVRLSRQLLAQGSMPSASGGPVGLNLSSSTSCGAGVRELSVGADGAVYPCHILMRPEYRLGNVFEEPLEDIRARALAMGFGALSVKDFEDCAECAHKYLCGGGCRGRSLFASGDLSHKDPYCTMMKDYYDHLGAALRAQFS